MAAIDAQQLNQWHRERLDELKRLADANGDLDERYRMSEVSFNYDAEDELLEITLGGRREAVSIDVADDVYLRYDPGTYKIVGIEIYHLKQATDGTR